MKLRRAQLLIMLMCALVSFPGATCAQPARGDAAPLWKLFTTHDYTAYLNGMKAQWTDGAARPATPIDLTQVTAVAISFDKTHAWKSEGESEFRRRLAVSADETHYYEALKALLQGWAMAAPLFFKGTPPPFTLWKEQIPLLRDHGYPAAANVYTAVAMMGGLGFAGSQPRNTVEDGVAALAALPVGESHALGEWLHAQLRSQWATRQAIARAALARAKSTPSAIEGRNYFEIARTFGDRGAFSWTDAERLMEAGKHELGIALAAVLLEHRPQDLDMQIAGARFYRRYATADETRAFYDSAVKRIAEPFQREIRTNYLSWLCDRRFFPKGDTIMPNFGRLGLADICLQKGRNTEAEQGYLAIMRAIDSEPNVRLDAAVGYMMVAPDAACIEIKNLLPEKLDGAIVRWMGNQLWQAARYHLDYPSRIETERLKKFVMLGNAVMQELIARDPVAALGGDARTSLRIPGAVLLHLVGRHNEATALLSRSITFEVPAPEGGWRGPPGSPAGPDANRPRVETSPVGDQADIWGAEAGQLAAGYASRLKTP